MTADTPWRPALVHCGAGGSRIEHSVLEVPHPSDQLVVHEGTHDVVVAAAREAAHAVDRVAPGADHDHRHVPVPRPPGLALAETAADLEPGTVGQHGVEEDEARPHLLHEIEGGGAAVRRKNLEAVVGELLLQVRAHRSLVLDDEGPSPQPWAPTLPKAKAHA